ncbi:hypothetical protein EJ06DRAFT_380064 [Trichodelitschia bisporula]|uniref:HMG box domain-containing protein n=1 Tax=Trichodelitschia bisporula TaxID=703511 RepID=A0A6G1HZ31_9PEZI|nr:hypothetical protein EJ06DRAFT_380064 [Trichodelitschia bisporula]
MLKSRLLRVATGTARVSAQHNVARLFASLNGISLATPLRVLGQLPKGSWGTCGILPQFGRGFTNSASRLAASAAATKTKAKAATKTKRKATGTKKTAATATKKKSPVRAKAKPAKKPAKKPATKRRELTPEQKERKLARAEKKKDALKKRARNQRLRELKEEALIVPKPLPTNPWVIFVKDNSQGGKLQLSELKPRYDDLDALERERLASVALENKGKNAVAHDEWLKKHTPDQIRLANRARRILHREKLRRSSKARVHLIHDPRQLTRPSNSFGLFINEKYSGDSVQGLTIKELMQRASGEWRSLSPEVKETYQAKNLAQRAQYLHDFKELYGTELGVPKVNPTKLSANTKA